MRLGVLFIAPRQLGAVESIPGRQFLPSVAWRTGQSGAPPDTVRCRFLSLFGEADHWRFRVVGTPDTVRCTLLTVGSATRVGRADCWLTGQSGAPPNSPVNYSRTPSSKSREQRVRRCQPGAPDTVRCTQTEQTFGCFEPSFPFDFSLILELRQTC
jgi:hypothetical protein